MSTAAIGTVVEDVAVTKPFVTTLTVKFVAALLNGLVKMDFYNDATITVPFLQEQLFADQTDAEKSLRVIDSFRSALQLAATQNWSVEQSTQYFQSGGLTEEQTEAVATVWKKEQKNVHDLLVAASGFSTPHFAALNWRLDVQSHARYVAEMNRPTAVVQISTKSTVGSTQLEFELDRTSVANVLLEMEKIDAIFAAAQ